MPTSVRVPKVLCGMICLALACAPGARTNAVRVRAEQTVSAQGTFARARELMPSTLGAATPSTSQASLRRASPPIKALFVGGGDVHEYATLIPFLTTELSRMMNIQFDLDSMPEASLKADFAAAHDVVIYNVCYNDGDSTALAHILAATRAGTPAVIIHCGVHSFQGSSLRAEWVELVGLDSRMHDAFGPFRSKAIDPVHPITKPFPADWSTPGDELYQTETVLDGTTALMTVQSPQDQRVHTVAWAHTYGKGRVFGTTLGHDMTTVQLPDYLRLIMNGLLWSTGHLQDDGTPAAGYGAPAAKKTP